MSGICGIVRFGGDPRGLSEIARMTRAMSYRGPDGIAHWRDDKVALGHCLLRTTDEAAEERQPLLNDEGNIVIVIDGTLWNAEDLRRDLVSAGARLRSRADSELVLRSYELWGRDFLSHVDGDFALAIYDRRSREIICARDRIGMRPLYWHQSPNNGFCFASDTDALLALPSMPHRLDESKLADALFYSLVDSDFERTFFESVSRLPPAHYLVASPSGLKRHRYWTYVPSEILRLRSDAAYESAFRSVLTQAVRRRLRGGKKTGSMLSGGVDSGAVSALAAEIRKIDNSGPHRTISAIGPDAHNCNETKAILTSAAADGLSPRYVDHAALGDVATELIQLTLFPVTPLDAHFSLIRAVYITARQSGLRAVLDGAGGDSILNDGQILAYLLRRGCFLSAAREARGPPGVKGLDKASVRLKAAAKLAFTPRWVRTEIVRARAFATPYNVSESLIREEFATRSAVRERLALLHVAAGDIAAPGSSAYRAQRVLRPAITTARERYESEAARIGLEARDPFLDCDVMRFCFSLPVSQLTRNGWPKWILRRALQPSLPHSVLWRPERTHLGWRFTSAVLRAAAERQILPDERALRYGQRYVDTESLRRDIGEFLNTGCSRNVRLSKTLPSLILAYWVWNQNRKQEISPELVKQGHVA